MANAYQFDIGYVCDQCSVCSNWHITGLGMAGAPGSPTFYYVCHDGANYPGTVVTVTPVAGPPPSAVINGIKTNAVRG
jgi:hypothetical protein